MLPHYDAEPTYILEESNRQDLRLTTSLFEF